MEKLIEFEGYEAYNESTLQDAVGVDMRRLGLLFVVAITLVFTVSCVSKEVPVTETYYQTESKTETYTDNITGEDDLTPETHWYCENLEISVKPAESEIPTVGPPPSFSKVWYCDYKLPEHKSIKVTIQTWEEGQILFAYDISNTGSWPKPPFDKALYTIYHYIGPGGYDFKSNNVYPYQIKQFNEWLDYFNAQLANSTLRAHYSKAEYQFDTTGVDMLAIIIAGREYRAQEDLNQNMGYGFIPQQPSIDPSPVKSIKLIWSDEVTKEREVSYQVEKQRTVMETKQVPFWEAIFH